MEGAEGCSGTERTMKLILDTLNGYSPAYGRDNWNIILEAGKLDAFEDYLENTYPEGIPSAALDMLLWDDQEMEAVFRTIGIENAGNVPQENKALS